MMTTKTATPPQYVPAELADAPIWLLWKYVDRDGKPTKEPFQPNGHHAKSNDPSTWSTLAVCTAALARDYDGIGLAFGNDLAGIDLDGCFESDGSMSPWAAAWFELCPPTYAELSPSGKGLHLLYIGELPEGLKGKNKRIGPKDNHKGIETYCYPSNKYFTFTGKPYPTGSAPAALARVTPDQFIALRDAIYPPAAVKPVQSAKPAQPIALDDQALIDKALSAANGAKFAALWRGDTSAYGGDDSIADAAMCEMLAYWFGGDAARIERLWLSSGLQRDKLQRADYRKMTIDFALSKVTTFYDPHYHAPVADVPEQPPAFDADTMTTQAPTAAAKDRKPATKSAAYITALGDLGYSFRLNELTQEIEVNGAPITDHVAAEIRVKMRDLTYTSTKAFEDAYIAHALRNSYHPIKSYLNSLKWDGLGHIEQLGACLADNHAPFANGDTVSARFLRRWLIGAVGKVFDRIQTPMLVIEGKQSLGKSHFVAWLASVLPDYFIEGPISPDDKDAKIRLMSRWIWEVSELGATTRRADVEALKSFITLRDVTVRKPYGHHDVHGPAVCSLIGTLNDSGGFLNDTTGSRRFLTLALTGLNWDYRQFVNVSQVWAQAVHLYRAGESPYLTPDERDKQNEINAEFTAVDPVEDVIASRFVIDPTRQDWRTPSIDVLTAVGDTLHGTSTGHARAIAAYLKSRGIVASRPYIGGRQVRGYCGVRPMTEVETNQMQDATRQQDR